MSKSRKPGQPPAAVNARSGDNTAPDIRACAELGMILECELAQIEGEIVRVKGIVADAIVTLSSSFDQLYHLCEESGTNSQDTANIDRAKAASNAIRALQFEDISAQALTEALNGVAYLRRLAEEVRTAHNTEDLALRMSKQHEIWATLRRKAVLQENLDEGSVDLF